MNDWDKHEGPTVTSCLQLKLWRTQRGHAGCSVQSAGDCSIFGCVYQKFTPKRLFQPEDRSGSGFGTRDLVFLHPIIKFFPVQMSYIATFPMDHEHA